MYIAYALLRGVYKYKTGPRAHKSPFYAEAVGRWLAADTISRRCAGSQLRGSAACAIAMLQR